MGWDGMGEKDRTVCIHPSLSQALPSRRYQGGSRGPSTHPGPTGTGALNCSRGSQNQGTLDPGSSSPAGRRHRGHDCANPQPCCSHSGPEPHHGPAPPAGPAVLWGWPGWGPVHRGHQGARAAGSGSRTRCHSPHAHRSGGDIRHSRGQRQHSCGEKAVAAGVQLGAPPRHSQASLRQSQSCTELESQPQLRRARTNPHQPALSSQSVQHSQGRQPWHRAAQALQPDQDWTLPWTPNTGRRDEEPRRGRAHRHTLLLWEGAHPCITLCAGAGGTCSQVQGTSGCQDQPPAAVAAGTLRTCPGGRARAGAGARRRAGAQRGSAGRTRARGSRGQRGTGTAAGRPSTSGGSRRPGWERPRGAGAAGTGDTPPAPGPRPGAAPHVSPQAPPALALVVSPPR